MRSDRGKSEDILEAIERIERYLEFGILKFLGHKLLECETF